MAQASFTYESFALPAFAAEPFTAKKLIPGGGRLLAAEFPLTDSRKPVTAGTLVGRTFADRAAGTGFGIAAVLTDQEIFLTAFTVQDALINSDVALLRHGTLVYEDLIPGWATLTADEQAAIRARYQCIVSAG